MVEKPGSLAVAGALVATVLAGTSLVGQAPGEAAWQVAITIDDIPMTGGVACTPETIDQVTTALLRQLAVHDITATAFVIPGTPCQGSDSASAIALASRWRRAGHEVGNHSWSHPDYNGLRAEDYLADVARADAALEPLLRSTGQVGRWFRPPLLHTGNTPLKEAALQDWLAANDYQMGVVTIDNQEWVFAAAYDRAMLRPDVALRDRIVVAYLAHLRESVAYARALAISRFGREIPQVLLLHANRLNGDHLARVLDMLIAEGATFTTLTEATRDPAYGSANSYVGPRGLSWLIRWAMTAGIEVPDEPREPDWVR